MAKILVAEDERDIRDLIKFTLTYGGHEVVTASNGEEAVELAPQVMPDLILLDVRMPKMTGYDACRALKSLDTVKHIPVVFLSAKGQDVEVKAGLEVGAIDYILKPFAPDQLNRRVNELLERAAQMAEEQEQGADDPEKDEEPAPDEEDMETQPDLDVPPLNEVEPAEDEAEGSDDVGPEETAEDTSPEPDEVE